MLETKDQIKHPLYLLFKKSLHETTIPEDWKLATVTPIFKKGNRSKAENYRPVSLTRRRRRRSEVTSAGQCLYARILQFQHTITNTNTNI